MIELFIILFEILLIVWSFHKGERWLRTTAFVHIFLVLALSRKLGNFFGLVVNINSVLYGTFFIAQHLLYQYFGKQAAKETVMFVLYGIFTVISIVGLVSPLQNIDNTFTTPITIYAVAKTMAILFSLIYFSQMLFLICLDKFGQLSWYKYLLINILVQGAQFIVTLPLAENKRLALNACAFRIIYITLLYPIMNWACRFRKDANID